MWWLQEIELVSSIGYIITLNSQILICLKSLTWQNLLQPATYKELDHFVGWIIILYKTLLWSSNQYLKLIIYLDILMHSVLMSKLLFWLSHGDIGSRLLLHDTLDIQEGPRFQCLIDLSILGMPVGVLWSWVADKEGQGMTRSCWESLSLSLINDI